MTSQCSDSKLVSVAAVLIRDLLRTLVVGVSRHPWQEFKFAASPFSRNQCCSNDFLAGVSNGSVAGLWLEDKACSVIAPPRIPSHKCENTSQKVRKKNIRKKKSMLKRRRKTSLCQRPNRSLQEPEPGLLTRMNQMLVKSGNKWRPISNLRLRCRNCKTPKVKSRMG
mmetsp:Transcript_134323/g.268086  ORF Transcript_134323/g.268086 Transcript_134323/m.268086 type:complete len:167 (-) Transcript_134323:43-543(-)